ncbi:MAG: hypothetical protein EA379_09350 [Phycisphaerales bacterium]|nr:MAG: hypothetical protein EA379_09350 [Phycisphaerales bacterium]
MACGAASVLLLAGMSGCEWWLSINQGGKSLAEKLIDDRFGDDDKPQRGSGATVTGGAGGAGGSSGGGAGGRSAASGAAGSESDEADTPQEAAAKPPRLTAHIGGHRWDVRALRITPIDHGALALEARLTNAGSPASVRIVFDSAGWPKDASGAPVDFDWNDERPDVERSTEMPTGEALSLDGRRHALALVGVNAALDRDPEHPRLTGIIDAHATRTTSEGHAFEQLLRVRFDVGVEAAAEATDR